MGNIRIQVYNVLDVRVCVLKGEPQAICVYLNILLILGFIYNISFEIFTLMHYNHEIECVNVYISILIDESLNGQSI